MDSISLYELTERIQDAVRLNFEQQVWVRAEIGELRENAAGHCYMELIEKSDDSDTLTAKVKATCWASIYRMLKPYFESETGQKLTSGLSVLIAVTVEFHTVYGLSLTIRDIDPVFTVGDLAIRRMRIIQQLQDDGIVEMNKLLPLPARPQRIAVISSGTAAGYDDFIHQLENNSYQYKFYPVLYAATMQGDGAVPSIIAALEKIYESIDCFDVVVIIRGGGATTDLACFDSYELAANCAQFPLPVFAGIGHQRDNSILDIVANKSLKTPTATAEFLIETMENTENYLYNVAGKITNIIFARVEKEKHFLQNKKWEINQQLRSSMESKCFELKQIQNRLFSASRHCVFFQKNKLTMLEKSIKSQSPEYVLNKGYSITTINGTRISSIKDIKAGDKIQTIVSDGTFESKIINNTNKKINK